MNSVDIYRKIRPLKKLLGLCSLKQKAVEAFLGVDRKDVCSGGELIEVYNEYLHTHDEGLLKLLLLHNEDDLKGMPSILPILCYADMMEAPFSLESQQIFTYDDMAGNACPFLSLTWKSRCAIPVPLAYDSSPVSLELNRDTLVCNIALYQGELKYFYSNYKDYYYLPLEDTAIHKSVGEYVDRDARTKATARTCYTKSRGSSSPSSALSGPRLSCRNIKHPSPTRNMNRKC